MRLPLYFFDTKIVGDLMQRIGDNGRIAAFIKSQMLDFLVAVCNLIALSALIWHYQKSILLIFAVGSIFSIAWSLYFGRRREMLDYRRFDASIENTDNLVETIIAMHEIRLNNATKWKIKRWTNIQTRLFEVNNLMLRLQQLQVSGATSINQMKNIIITFWAANLVISGNLSLGEMIGLSAVIGQLSVPLFQMTNFIQSFQDTRSHSGDCLKFSQRRTRIGTFFLIPAIWRRYQFVFSIESGFTICRLAIPNLQMICYSMDCHLKFHAERQRRWLDIVVAERRL